jgi:hypothetical protein
VKGRAPFGRDHFAAVFSTHKAHGTRAAAVQTRHKLRQVVAHIARGVLRGAAIQVGAGRCRGGRRVRHLAGVAGGGQHLGKRHAQFVGHDLRDLGVQALAHFGAAVVHLHAAVGVHMHQRTGLVKQVAVNEMPNLTGVRAMPRLMTGLPLFHAEMASRRLRYWAVRSSFDSKGSRMLYLHLVPSSGSASRRVSSPMP